MNDKRCPSCNNHVWPQATCGMRSCPQCHASVVCTKTDIRLHRSAHIRRVSLAAQRHTERIAVARERLYKVPDSHGKVLCAVCGERTRVAWSPDDMSTPPAIDGYVDTPMYGRVRGYICHVCTNAHGALSVHDKDLALTIRRENERGTVVRPVTFNTATQRIEAEQAEILIERARRNLIEQGCPTWAAFDEAVRQTASADGPTWAHTFDGRWLGWSALYVGRAVKAGFNTTLVIPNPTPEAPRPDDYDDSERNVTTLRKALSVRAARLRLLIPAKLPTVNPVPVTSVQAPRLFGPSVTGKGARKAVKVVAVDIVNPWQHARRAESWRPIPKHRSLVLKGGAV